MEAKEMDWDMREQCFDEDDKYVKSYYDEEESEPVKWELLGSASKSTEFEKFCSEIEANYEKLPRRLGNFTLDGDFIRHYPATAMKFMSQMAIVRCEHLYATDVFLYTAMSPLFDVLEVGYVIPTYSITMYQDGTIKAEQVK